MPHRHSSQLERGHVCNIKPTQVQNGNNVCPGLLRGLGQQPHAHREALHLRQTLQTPGTPDRVREELHVQHSQERVQDRRFQVALQDPGVLVDGYCLDVGAQGRAVFAQRVVLASSVAVRGTVCLPWTAFFCATPAAAFASCATDPLAPCT